MGPTGFETLVAGVTTSLLAAVPEQIEPVATGWLERMREFFAADGCALLAVDENGRTVSVRHASAAADARRLDGAFDPAQLFPWSWRRLAAERAPVCIAGLADLPPEAAADRENLSRLGVPSVLAIPVETAAGLGDVIVAHNVRQEREWPDDVVSRLHVLGELLVCALQRRDMILEGHKAAEQLQLVADSGEAGLWSLDLAAQVLWATPRARVVFGFSEDEALTIDRFWRSVHPEDREFVETAQKRAAAGTGPVRVEFRVVSPREDDVRWVSTRGRTHVGPDGRAFLMGISLDITERVQAQQALAASEARLAAGAELAGLAFADTDWRAGRLVHADARLRDLLGFPPEGGLTVEASALWARRVHPDDNARIMEQRRMLFDGEVDRTSVEYRYLHPDRGELWIQHLASIAQGTEQRTLRTYGVIRDITASKRAEEELHDLSRRLIGAHEEERALLARELHDDVSQRLAVLAIEAGRAELSEREGPGAEALHALREGLVRVSEDVHSLAYQLHPSLLEELGLAEALRAECEHRGRQHEFEVVVDIRPFPSAVDTGVALCLFRVAQEALGNAGRHAAASTVTVSLMPADGGLLLAVADDGVGFEPEEQAAGRHLGLVSMRERTSLVGGTLDVESAPGRGTTVVAWTPLKEGPG